MSPPDRPEAGPPAPSVPTHPSMLLDALAWFRGKLRRTFDRSPTVRATTRSMWQPAHFASTIGPISFSQSMNVHSSCARLRSVAGSDAASGFGFVGTGSPRWRSSWQPKQVKVSPGRT